MPTYSFFCEKCQHSFEVLMSFSQYDNGHSVVCERCSSKDIIRNYQEDMSSLGMSIKKADSELKTIGDLANRNRDRMSNDHKAALHHKHNSYKDNTSDKPLPQGMSRMKKGKKTNWRNLGNG